MGEVVETQQLDAQALKGELGDQGLSELPPGVMVYEIAGPMFFGAVENFERAAADSYRPESADHPAAPRALHGHHRIYSSTILKVCRNGSRRSHDNSPQSFW